MKCQQVQLGGECWHREDHPRSLRTSRSILLVCLLLWGLSVCPFVPLMAADTAARLNQIQVIGTHNSYHLEPSATVVEAITTVYPGAKTELAYRHRPLQEQFDKLGVRQVELDLFADPDGGHFGWPLGARLDGLSREEFDPRGIWQQPGYKIMHVQDVDYRTTVPTFRAALRQINRWSLAHPRHVPIMVLLELKERAIVGLTRPVAMTRDRLRELEAEIREVLEVERILRPDDVRGTASCLRDAVIKSGWPALQDVAGRVLFGLDNEGQLRDRYLELHPGLRDGLLFVSVPESHPAAAWMKINDPVSAQQRIQRLVKSGFLVRTRADADTQQARRKDVRRRNLALSSGAHFVSTDYPEPDSRLSDYHVRLPGGVVARANPVSGAHLRAGEWEVDLRRVP
ncbi:MAG: Ca2+-dependent phosphoinositide-specific phospholipase C [Planctomycetota bacterium]|nr:Ca2+-dependent phosphoinositide-specific phospholipase C [Planctomycetota bacterium]